MTRKNVYLALSVPNRYGQRIFANFADAADKNERFRIYSPLHREYWPENKIQEALSALIQDLQKRGYTVEVVSISEYNILCRRSKAI